MKRPGARMGGHQKKKGGRGEMATRDRDAGNKACRAVFSSPGGGNVKEAVRGWILGDLQGRSIVRRP
jgi:hypothetical protein